MAMIASTRPIIPPHIGALVDVKPAGLSRPLKRSPRKPVKQGMSEAVTSIRDCYLASADRALKDLKDSSGPVLSQDLDHLTVPETHMAPFSGYKRLSSGPPSPAVFNTSAVANVPATSQEVKLTDIESSEAPSRALSLKAACEKPLPPKPTLRPQESPERRGVFDAQDLTASLLNGRYPPLEPTSSPDVDRYDQESPAPSSFQVTPSLLSRNQSPYSGSPSVVEYGIATSTIIQPVISSHVSADTNRAYRTSSSTYTLNAPGSSKIPRHSSHLHNGQARYGSPSRTANSGSKINRSILRGRQALSVRGRSSLPATDSQRLAQSATKKEDFQVNLAVASTTGGSSQRSNLKNPLRESIITDGIQRTSSKYGYNIRESLDAREAIMGQPESTVTPPARTPPYPPRTSSLPKTPSPCAIGSASTTESLPTSRLSLLYRQTAASSARASFNAKKISEFRASTSRLPQSRTRASLGDVGKGMKNLGKKVGKIIPHRRSIAAETSSNQILTKFSEDSHRPRRHASRLLTTYKNSGMEDSSEEVFHRSVNIADGFTPPEPNDRHEPYGAEQEKEMWNEGSHSRAHDAETGRFVHFGVQDVGRGDDEEDERPPSRRDMRDAPGGHYTEDAADAGRNERTENAATVPSNDSPDNSADAALPPTRQGSIGSSVTAIDVDANGEPGAIGNSSSGAAHGLVSDAEFGQMLIETDTRSRSLLSYAIGLEESPLRTLMIESATHLAEGLMHARLARIELVRTNQALDEAVIMLAAHTHRMSFILQQISGRSA